MSIVPDDLQRRHFEYIAATIKALPDSMKRSDVAVAFAKALQPTNVNFKRGRFVVACEPAVGEIDEALRDLAPETYAEPEPEPKPEPEAYVGSAVRAVRDGRVLVLDEPDAEPEDGLGIEIEPEPEPADGPEPELALSDLAALLRKELHK